MFLLFKFKIILGFPLVLVSIQAFFLGKSNLFSIDTSIPNKDLNFLEILIKVCFLCLINSFSSKFSNFFFSLNAISLSKSIISW